jgi:hypothetical protein
VHHAEQPPLPRVGDIRGRVERSPRSDAGVPHPADEIIDVVGLGVVVDEVRDSSGKAEEAQTGVLGDLRLGGAEAGTPEQMLEILFPLWCHGPAVVRGRSYCIAAELRVKSGIDERAPNPLNMFM